MKAVTYFAASAMLFPWLIPRFIPVTIAINYMVGHVRSAQTFHATGSPRHYLVTPTYGHPRCKLGNFSWVLTLTRYPIRFLTLHVGAEAVVT